MNVYFQRTAIGMLLAALVVMALIIYPTLLTHLDWGLTCRFNYWQWFDLL